MRWKTFAVEALRVRALALEILADPETPPPPDLWTDAIHCASESWRLFLTAERCAIPLEKVLRAVDRLPASIERVLHRRAREEMARVLSARIQLRHIGELAGQLGAEARPVVLKGGWCVLGDDPLDLSDIDVLLPGDQATTLAAALDARGHEATFSNPQHLRARLTPQALPVEIHLTLDPSGRPPEERLWHGITPVPSTPGLWRLSPAEHLWHVVRHATVDHPSRRGTAPRSPPDRGRGLDLHLGDLAEVTTRVERHESRSTLRDVLTMALDISR